MYWGRSRWAYTRWIRSLHVAQWTDHVPHLGSSRRKAKSIDHQHAIFLQNEEKVRLEQQLVRKQQTLMFKVMCVFPHFPWTNCTISSLMQKLLRRCAIGEKLKHTIFCFSLIDSFMKVDLSMQSELLFFSKITGTACISIVHNPWLHWQRTTVVTIVYVVRHAWSFKLSLDQSRGTYLSSQLKYFQR